MKMFKKNLPYATVGYPLLGNSQNIDILRSLPKLVIRNHFWVT